MLEIREELRGKKEDDKGKHFIALLYIANTTRPDISAAVNFV